MRGTNSDLQVKVGAPVPRRSKRKVRRWFWTIFWLFVWTTGLLIGSVLGYLTFAGEGSVRRAFVAYLQRKIEPEVAFPGRDSITILVMGADEDRDNRKRVVRKAARTDTIMVARVDFRNKRVDAISIPRDTLVRIPKHGWGKINSAYALGGAELAIRTVGQLLGDLQIDYAAVLNYQGFKRMVDLIGGVYLYVEKPLHYDDNWGDLHVHLPKGWQWLDGEKALGFVRYRHSDSDLHRIERQKVFLNAAKERLKKPQVWLQLPHLLNEAQKSIESEFTYEQMLALAYFAKSIPQPNIRVETLPVRNGRGTYLLVDRKKAEQLLRKLRFWEPERFSLLR